MLLTITNNKKMCSYSISGNYSGYEFYHRLLSLVVLFVALVGCSLSGNVSRDGVGLAGVEVTLNSRETTVTDQNGNYRFNGVSIGNHRIALKPPPGYSGAASIDIDYQNVFAVSHGHDFNLLSDTERTLVSGSIIGTQEQEGSYVWRGVPFAQPPTDDLRWKATQDISPWTDNYIALANGSACAQLSGSSVWGSEDCLYLNVWTPDFSSIPAGDDRVPVMVWVHGGANVSGEGALYDGHALAARYGVIVVAINYRLGPFGWFSHPALRTSNNAAEDNSGNFGTLDIIKALEWVRVNIGEFGGDPNNVMVFGESAGAINLLSLLTSPKASATFSKAAIQSGLLAWSTRTEAEAFSDEGGRSSSSSNAISELLIADQLASDSIAARALQLSMSDVDMANYLHSKTTAELITAYANFDRLTFPSLIRDGVVLPDVEPLALFQTGAYHQVPVIIGTTLNESKPFILADPLFTTQPVGDDLLPTIKDENFYALADYYFSAFWKATGVDEIAQAMRLHQTSIYAYRFDWDEAPVLFDIDLSFVFGAAHTFEIPFVFGVGDGTSAESLFYSEENLPGRLYLNDHISSYWAEFAFNGSPGFGHNAELYIEWQPWQNGPQQERLLILDTPADGDIRMSPFVLSRSELQTELQLDTRFTTNEQKCQVYTRLFGSDSYAADNCSSL